MLPKRLDRKTIYESQWINLYIDKVLMPSGKIIEKYHQLYYHKEGVVVLLFNSKGEICFIKSKRYTTQKIEWELPAGGIDKDEEILTAAKREVMEETGLTTNKLKLHYSYNPSNGMSNQSIHIAIGNVKNNIQAEFDTDEVKEIKWLSSDEVKNLIKRNDITCGVSLTTLLFYFSGMMSNEDIK